MEAEDLGCGLTAGSITAASAAAAAFTWQAHWQASSRWPAATAAATAATAAVLSMGEYAPDSNRTCPIRPRPRPRVVFQAHRSGQGQVGLC